RIPSLSHRITPIFYVLLARHAKRIKWKFVHARGARANLIERRALHPCRKIDVAGSTLQLAGACALLWSLFFCSRGGTGRRVRLRTVWGNPWRFESSREH